MSNQNCFERAYRGQVGFVLLLPFLTLGSSLWSAKTMPSSPLLAQAKTIAVLNNTVFPRAEQAVCLELSKWGRYQVIADSGKSDLILMLSTQVPIFPAVRHSISDLVVGHPGNYSGKLYLAIFDRKTLERVWIESFLWEERNNRSTPDILKSLRRRVEASNLVSD